MCHLLFGWEMLVCPRDVSTMHGSAIIGWRRWPGARSVAPFVTIYIVGALCHNWQRIALLRCSMIKVAHYSHSDTGSGAGRAAWRLHRALMAADVDSTMTVIQADSGDWTVAVRGSPIDKAARVLRTNAARLVCRALRTDNPILHSPAMLRSRWPERINRSSADLVHLHWIGHEMMSVEDVARIKKPLVWTLHDMWAFAGAEHVVWDERWRDGYLRDNRPSHEKGFDLNRWVWRRKQRAWRVPIQIVAPSRWLAACVAESALMRKWPVAMIPNALDVSVWRPVDRAAARQMLGFGVGEKVIVFGALGGAGQHNKGFDLLQKALQHLRSEVQELKLVVFGESEPRERPDFGFPVTYTGRLHDDISLRVLYSAADLVVVPSRIEAFGQAAAEAHACGTPVVAFDTSGLRDIIIHRQTGWLAESFDTLDLAGGMFWVLSNSERAQKLGEMARQHVMTHFATPVVARQYETLYRATLCRYSRAGNDPRV